MSNASFTYLTDEVLSEFLGRGCETLIQFLQAPDQSEEQVEDISSQIFTELLLIYEKGNLSKEDVTEFLSLAIQDESVAILFCDVLDVFPATSSIQDLLLEIYKKQSIIKYTTLAKLIDPDTLAKLSIVPSDVLNRQLNTRKRDVFYTQKKYNLLHEELEGYSKLIVELYRILKSEDTNYQLSYALKVIEGSIGHYSLDPNRVLDIIIDIYTNNFVGNHEFAIQLLKNSRWWPSIESDCSTSIEKLNIGGNESAAKCIGLKLLKCPKDRDLPETFKILIACLIKEGFVSFGSIWKYVRPDKEEMDLLESEYKKELEEQVFKASASALALAAPLADDEEAEESSKKTSNTKKQADNTKTSMETKLLLNLKFGLLKVFLGNGLYWPSIYILTEYPFLAYVQPEVHELMSRCIEVMIEPLYTSINPLSAEILSEIQTGKKIAFPRPLNTVAYDEFPCTHYLSFKPTIKSFSLKKFHYFYTKWTDKLPVVSSIDDLFKMSAQFLKFIGVNISQNLELFTKLCDIIVWDLSNNGSEEKNQKWFNYFRNYIFPSIPLIKENAFAVDKAYDVLKHFLPEERFNLYGEMYQVLSKNNSYIRMAYGKAEKSTKDVLKRLSKENVRPMMRRLAKISFSNPLPCFLTILQQIESYDNLNTLVVETARYFNSYGWDVLTLAILLRLTATGRSNVQTNGLNDRQWIQSLSSFIGKICQRYPNSIDLNTLLQFLLKSFFSKETPNMIVLKEILLSMGGIQAITNLTLQQVNMINCGGSLEKLVYKTIDDTRYDKVKSGVILVKSLQQLGITNELFISICQLGNVLTSNTGESHLKVLANKGDDLNSLLHLFTQVIGFFGKDIEVANTLIPISQLVSEYEVLVELAYELWRPFLSLLLESDDKAVEMIRSENKALFETLSLPKFSVELYSSFWMSSLYDINFSSALYDEELKKLTSNKESLQETISMSKRNRDISRLVVDKYRKDLQQLESFIKSIPDEKVNHEQHFASVTSRFETEASLWFPDMSDEDIMTQTKSFLQYCVLPRAIHSSFDAAFTAKFLFLMHSLKVANFSLILILDELIKSKIIFGTLFTLTPTEAENFGLFFAEILKSLNSWTEKSAFDEAFSENESDISFDDFRSTLYGYHSLLLSEILTALEVKDYMSRRNAITFLKNLLGVYPTVEDHCEKAVALIENISKNDPREDLKLSSSALIGHVKSRSKNWVHLWDFISMPESEKEEHIKKRDEIKEKEELAKKKIQEERAKKLMEEQAKIKAEQIESAQQKRLASALSYEDSGNVTKRVDSRGSEGSKNRYAYYSKYGNQQKDSSAQSASESTSESKKDFKSEENGSNTPKQPKEPEKISDLKAKLLEAKKEYRDNKFKDLSVSSSRSATPVDKDSKKPYSIDAKKVANLPVHPNSGNKTTNQNSNSRPTNPSSNTRPANPSSNTRPSNPSSNTRPTNPSSNARPANPSSSSRTPSSSSNTRPANPSSSNRPPHPSSTNKPPHVSASKPVEAPKPRAPLPPQPSTKGDSNYGDRRMNARQPYSQTNNRYNDQRIPKPPSARLPQNPNFSRPPSNSNVNSRNQTRSLPPPPPPPPLSLKGTGGLARIDNSSGSNNNQNNNRNNYRYDPKRKHESYNSGRGYDKKQRY